MLEVAQLFLLSKLSFFLNTLRLKWLNSLYCENRLSSFWTHYIGSGSTLSPTAQHHQHHLCSPPTKRTGWKTLHFSLNCRLSLGAVYRSMANWSQPETLIFIMKMQQKQIQWNSCLFLYNLWLNPRTYVVKFYVLCYTIIMIILFHHCCMPWPHVWSCVCLV